MQLQKYLIETLFKKSNHCEVTSKNHLETNGCSVPERPLFSLNEVYYLIGKY